MRGIPQSQSRWFREHKTIHITNAAHAAIIRFAGKLQIEWGKEVSVSDAIENMAKRIEKTEGGENNGNSSRSEHG
jgi:hypothetical protein